MADLLNSLSLLNIVKAIKRPQKGGLPTGLCQNANTVQRVTAKCLGGYAIPDTGRLVAKMPRRQRAVKVAIQTSIILISLFMSLRGHSNTDAQTNTITVKADQLALDQESGTQIMSGNVVIKQAGVSIHADHVEINTRNGAISRIFGKGNPIRFQQLLNNGKLIQTESNEIDYVTSSWTLVFKGKVKLQRANWQLSGHTVEYNIRNKNFSAKGFSKSHTATKTPDRQVAIKFGR